MQLLKVLGGKPFSKYINELIVGEEFNNHLLATNPLLDKIKINLMCLT